jgi:hypothetical protein
VITGVRDTERIRKALIEAGVPDTWLNHKNLFTEDAT